MPMSAYRTWFGIALFGSCLVLSAARAAETGAETGAEPAPAQGWRAISAPRPQHVPPPKPEELDAALRRGVDFLVARQNPDGSWGSARQTKGLNIYAPAPGAHHAFRAGVTALCVAALIETHFSDEAVGRAIDRGEAWLCAHLPKLRRASPDTIYNNWGHAYGLLALAKLYDRKPEDAPRRAELLRQMRQQIDLLRRYECVDGGWCYYDFEAHTQRPSGSTISFVTATVLLGFDEARRVGVEVPQALVDRGLESLRRQRKPDFSYCYGEYLKYVPVLPVNRPGGSLGRSQACNLAMRRWGDTAITDEVLTTWLDRLFARNLWLRYRPEAADSARVAFPGCRVFLLLWALLRRAMHRGAQARETRRVSRPLGARAARPAGQQRFVVGFSAVRLSRAVRHGVRGDVAVALPAAVD